MLMTNISTFLEQNSAIISLIFLFILILFSWHKAIIPFDLFKQRKIKKLLQLINKDEINVDLKKIALEQLQVEYFSYAFNLRRNGTIFINGVINLIKKSKGFLDINDFRLAQPYIIVSEKKIAIKNNFNETKNNISLWLSSLSFLSLIYAYSLDGFSYDEIFLSFVLTVFTAFAALKIPKQNSSVKKIQTALKDINVNSKPN